MENEEHCAICGCVVKKSKQKNIYGKDNKSGRSYPTEHHYVAKRFIGLSKTGRRIFKGEGPWRITDKPKLLCFDCHEELLHNPVLLEKDIDDFKELVGHCGLGEVGEDKKDNKCKLAGRIILLHEVIATGIKVLHDRTG